MEQSKPIHPQIITLITATLGSLLPVPCPECEPISEVSVLPKCANPGVLLRMPFDLCGPGLCTMFLKLCW